jgi:cation:H+ antiporter
MAAILFSKGEISRVSGVILIISLFAYFAATLYFVRKEGLSENSGTAKKVSDKNGLLLIVDILFIVGGVLVLILGSNLVVDAATNVAETLGVSHAVIGLTIVGMGTSIPEFATSIVAALRKQPDMAIGNVVGSNIFNILGVLGFSSLLTPLSAPGVSLIDWIVMVLFATLLLPLAWTGRTLDRREGAFFLISYCLYMWWLWSAK